MCRHLAYLGDPVPLHTLLVDPQHSLYRQSWAPRRQTSGVVNADGFGVGWYVPGSDMPARHRAAGPIWADETFADLARVIVTPALLAAVRSATVGMSTGPSAAAPFRDGRWLFSHNGAVAGWPQVASRLAWGLDPGLLALTEAPTDSALLWAITRHLLAAGKSPEAALAEVVGRVAAADTSSPAAGRSSNAVNLLLTDGSVIAATAYGASLCWRRTPGGVVVASEPHDDEPGWQDVPDRHLVLAGRRGDATVEVVVEPLQPDASALSPPR